jgi:hypothetical protein
MNNRSDSTKVDHLSGSPVYKKDLFVPFIQEKEMDEVLTEFTMEEFLTMPKGVLREFNSPLKDRTGRMKIAITDAFCIWDGTVVADTDTAPWVHYNDKIVQNDPLICASKKRMN